jgi:hypothetical protein
MQPLCHCKKKVTFWFANGAAGDDLIQAQGVPFEGEILNIHQVNSFNTGARTAKLAIVDEFGITIFDGTARAHNASYDHEFGVTIRRILAGKDSLRCTISGDPGASGYRIDAVVSFFGRAPMDLSL